MRKIGVMAAFAAVTFSFQAWAEVVIGIAVPAGGVKADAGREIVRDAEARLKSTPSLRSGEPIRLQVVDDECTADGGERIAKAFVEANVALVIGHPCSNAAIAAAKIYAAANVYFVALGATHPDLTIKRAGPTIFRMAGRDDRQAADTADALLKVAGGTTIAIVHDRTAYAKGLAEGVTRRLLAKGYSGLLQETIVAGEKSYANLVASLAAAKVGAVYFAGFPAEARIIARQLRRGAGIEATVVGSDAVYDLDERTVLPAPPSGPPELWAMTRSPSSQTGDTISSWMSTYDVFGPNVTAEQMMRGLMADTSGDRIGPSFVMRPTSTH